MAKHPSPRETFEFDLNGFCVLRNFFPESRVDQMDQVIEKSPIGKKVHKFLFITLDDLFLKILTDSRILKICEEWIGPHFRFDHAWGLQHFPGDGDPHQNLHGGPYAEQGFAQYHWFRGKPICTCLIFGIPLAAQLPGQGGAVFIPGSHKSNSDMDGWTMYCDILEEKIEGVSWVVEPELLVGDLLVFTDSIMHGTKPWKALNRHRRMLYLKYSNGAMGWMAQDDEESVYLRSKAKTPLEKNLFRTAHVSLSSGNELQLRPKTVSKKRLFG